MREASSSERPRMRPLEVHEVADTSRTGVVLVDPMGLAPGRVFVPEALLPIVGRFDGTHTIEEIEDAAAARGARPPAGLVAEIARQFEEGLLLEGDLFRDTLARTAEDFARRRTRPARHAGSAGYPADQDACARALGQMLQEVERGCGPAPRALIAPHIDLGRGSAGYAAVYGHLAGREGADLYVVLATGHAGPSAPVTGLCQDWETPRGRLTTDRGFVENVHARIGRPDPVDVFLHRDEHSIEFQMLWLAHLLGDRAGDARVAGFLCGELPSAEGDPDGEDYVADIVAALREADQGRQVCYVAGADLAHVGPFFGDRAAVDEDRLARLGDDDRARLAHLECGRPGRFHRAVVAAGNPDRVCSATAIYLVARLADTPARILHYGQAVADDGSQCVTFCSAVFD